MNNPQYTRRDFLRHLTVVSAALLPLTAAGAAAGRWIPVGKANGFKPGQVHACTLPGGQPIFVRRLPGRSPRFLALSALCTHKGCRVAFVPADQKYHCPCHRGLFDAAGRNVSGPPPSPLPALPTQVRGGVVFVQA